MNFVSRDLVQLIYPKGIPSFWTQVLSWACCDQFLSDFKLVAVLEMSECYPVRLTWSAQGEEQRWKEVLSPFLSQHQREILAFDKKCRKVIDSDSKRHWLFLDDLHEHEEGEVMTRVFGASHQEDYVIALTSSPLSVAIPSSIRFSSFFLALLSIGGRWAYKTSIEGTCISLLWISEARWKGNIKACKECIERFSPPPLWSALCAYMDKNNGVAYPDVVEFYVDGRIELSVAFLL